MSEWGWYEDYDTDFPFNFILSSLQGGGPVNPTGCRDFIFGLNPFRTSICYIFTQCNNVATTLLHIVITINMIFTYLL